MCYFQPSPLLFSPSSFQNELGNFPQSLDELFIRFPFRTFKPRDFSSFFSDTPKSFMIREVQEKRFPLTFLKFYPLIMDRTKWRKIFVTPSNVYIYILIIDMSFIIDSFLPLYPGLLKFSELCSTSILFLFGCKILYP